MSDVITVPDSVAQRIYQKFPGARNVNQISRWVAPCEYLQNQNMTVSLNIGGDVYPIDTSDMGSLSGDKISDDDARRYGLDDKVMSYCTGIFAR